MREYLLALAAVVLSGCVGAQPWLKRDLTITDLQKHRSELIGQQVSVYAATEQRYGRRSPTMLWLSAAARAHPPASGGENFCIWADDPSGRLANLKPWAPVRVRGVIRVAEGITPEALECESQLIVSVETVEVLPSFLKR